MSRKNKTQEVNVVEVSNIEAAVQPIVEAETVVETQEESTNAVDQATKEIEELKAKMAEAKKKLAEAKKANTKSRPVRMSTFIVRVSEDREGDGAQLIKSDVHYCAEKAAIDVITEDIKCGTKNNYIYTIWKQSKSDESNAFIVERLWIDPETSQIVIE